MDYFDFVATGTKGFSTYVVYPLAPGIGLLASQMDGAFWSPDQTWTATGETFASIGLNPGTYTVADNATGESITYQISTIPEPSRAMLSLVGIAAIGLRRRRS